MIVAYVSKNYVWMPTFVVPMIFYPYRNNFFNSFSFLFDFNHLPSIPALVISILFPVASMSNKSDYKVQDRNYQYHAQNHGKQIPAFVVGCNGNATGFIYRVGASVLNIRRKMDTSPTIVLFSTLLPLPAV